MKQSDTGPDNTGLRKVAAVVGERVEATMRADQAAALAGADPLLNEVLDYALFNGGKRIRPLLTVLCSRCCGRDEEDLYLLAAAFEYLHVASLIHDDVIDRAEQRRGRATVLARFGMTSAILAGDWLHAQSMYLIGRLAGSAGLEIFCRATTSMVNGEFAQLRLIGDTRAGEVPYFAVIRQKTGNLIASTCALGALYAGAETSQRAALAAYGDHLGAAFQVVDDLLDFLGDEQSTGKKIGNDFIEGKVTLPLLHALARADGSQRREMEGLMHGDRTIPGSYERLRSLIGQFDGFATAARTARQLVQQATECLDIFPDQEPARENVALLKELAAYILTRTK